MDVSNLQQLMTSLARTFSGDSAKVAKELDALADGLEPFKDWKISELTRFLATAEEYWRTGAVSSTSSKSRTAAPDAAKVEKSVAQLQLLFDKAIDSDTSYSKIEEEVKAIGKSLKKAEAIEVAKKFGIAEAIKSKTDALAKIEERIARRKEGHNHLSSVRDM